MIVPVILVVIAATFYAITNHIDKYLISKAVKNADWRALIIVSTIIAGGVMALIYSFVCNFELAFDIPSILLLLFNSVLYTVATIFYYRALDRDDTTIVVIMFQFISVFMLLLAPFILRDQHINPLQLVGGLLITLAAVFLTYEPTHKKFNRRRLITLAIMAFVSLTYAIWYIIERYVNQEHDFNQTTFWSNITLFFVGIFLFAFIKSFRKSFSKMLKANGPKVIGLNLINEMFNSFAGVLSTFAGTMASLALMSFVSQGLQPFIVMILGILITKLFPKIEKEKVTKVEVVKRVIAMVICVVGLGLIQFG
ncbi:EamA family transporter [Candidatus Saccharibacteria bacterium]|nr:EamA family transporter [Candidatus Saccharibacteria bacterium]